MGRWFEIERYFPIVFELGVNCGQANYELKDNQHVRVENKGYNKWYVQSRGSGFTAVHGVYQFAFSV